ncbi:hypothetical protein DFJ77DRAFT_481304 [Powellomyces hirtus]|nr:hypothetical protein DFJ77DRAFT_481304 [Powellomyces hirtus]
MARTFLTLSAAVVLASALLTNAAPAQKCRPTVCNTEACVAAAKEISSAIDSTADPCQDFYQYACGNWIKSNPIPAGRTRWGMFNLLNDRNNEIVKQTLEGQYATDPSVPKGEEEADRQNFAMVQKLYNSCMDEKAIEAQGLAPMQALLKKAQGTFPLSSSDSVKTMKAMASVHDDAVSALFSFYISSDDKSPTDNIITLGQGGLTLPSKEYYLEADVVETLVNTVATVLSTVLGGGDFKARAQAVVDFESKLAGLFVDEEVESDPIKSYNPFTLSSFSNLSKTLSWETYFKSRFPEDKFPGFVNNDMKLLVRVPSFFEKLPEVIKATSPAALQDYILFRYVSGYRAYGAKPLRDLFAKLAEATGSSAAEPPRWNTCLPAVDGSLGEVLGRYFIVKAFPGNSKGEATTMVDYVTNAFVSSLPTTAWLDDVTRAKALEKAKAIVTKIGYADIVMQPKNLAEKYEAVKIGDVYFDNMLNYRQWSTQKDLSDILKKVDKMSFGMTPPTVNAYYNPSGNEIAFPAGILQRPFYNAGVPAYLNYGGIGAVIGHEITHGFDDAGRHYAGDGRLEEWWTNSTAVEFEDRAKCFIDQYAGYQITGPSGEKVNVNGVLTLGENLADNGGVAESLLAWRADKAAVGGDARNRALPGMEKFSPEQLFFLSFAQVWCNNVTPAAALSRVRTDPHAPPNFRVIGTVANSPEFSTAFQCQAGSPMNPANKCKVW